MDAAFLKRINAQRLDTNQLNPVTTFQIALQMAHRLVALSIIVLIGCVAWKARREQGAGSLGARFAAAWFWLICVQAGLGAVTIWSNKAADVATAHVLCGALSLLAGTILTVGFIQRRFERQLMPDHSLSDILRDGAIPEFAAAKLKEAT